MNGYLREFSESELTTINNDKVKKMLEDLAESLELYSQAMPDDGTYRLKSKLLRGATEVRDARLGESLSRYMALKEALKFASLTEELRNSLRLISMLKIGETGEIISRLDKISLDLMREIKMEQMYHSLVRTSMIS